MTARRYAESTQVSSDTSRAEIERTLRRYGATGFAYGWQGNQAQVAFEMASRHVIFRLRLPDRNDSEFTHTPERGLERTPAAAEQAYEQAVRQRWRALALVIKAKLEAVEAGISTVDEEFLARIALPDGRVVADWLAPQLDAVYARNEMPALLPGGSP